MGTTLTIDFHGDAIAAILDGDRTLVPLRPLVVGMGLQWSAQLKRVRRDLVLGPAVAMMATDPVSMTDTPQTVVCLPLDLIPGFLFGVDASRVTEAVRTKVLEYRRECFRVLADACLGPRGVGINTPAETLPSPSPRLPEGIAARLVTEARMTFGTPASRALWFRLGLPVVAEMRPGPAAPDLFTYRREA